MGGKGGGYGTGVKTGGSEPKEGKGGGGQTQVGGREGDGVCAWKMSTHTGVGIWPRREW